MCPKGGCVDEVKIKEEEAQIFNTEASFESCQESRQMRFKDENDEAKCTIYEEDDTTDPDRFTKCSHVKDCYNKGTNEYDSA